MPLQGEYEPSPADWVRDQVDEYERSGGTSGTTLRGVPVVVVTSLGASSGKLRKNPVMRVEHDGAYAAVASKGGTPENPGWYRNLVAHPLVELQDGAARADYTAREVAGDERELGWTRAVEVWPDYADYQT
ncbi:MAG: nitroreductase family deazaflavin-dependent oxidoreductase, partial [Solirubrobacteraceae bacterium]